MCTCEQHTDHGAPGPAGRLTLHPWPLSRSAGQTLTLEQMDNGLDALSAPGHTLRLPALAAALPFTSACPPFLLLHPSCSAPDCLNTRKTLELHFLWFFFVCFGGVLFFVIHFSNASLPPPLQLDSTCVLFNHLFLIVFIHSWHDISSSVHHPSRWIFSVFCPRPLLASSQHDLELKKKQNIWLHMKYFWGLIALSS